MTLVLFTTIAFASAPTTARYDFISSGKITGGLARSMQPDGSIRVDFQFTENGRGPKLAEIIRLDPKGNVVALDVTGTTTFGSKVDEHFIRDPAQASWKTTADQGSARNISTHALYLPIAATPDVYARVVRAALDNHGKLEILPGGEVRVERLRSLELQGATGPQKVYLYSISGIDYSPEYVWVDGNGQLFAWLDNLVPPFGLIAQGYNAQAERLVSARKEAEGAQLERLAVKVRHQLDSPLAIRNVRVFDPRSSTLGQPSTVYLFRGRVSSIFPAEDPVPDDVAQVDAGGKTLLPGLIDMHGHESPWNAALQIAGGVTTERDLGNSDALLLGLERQIVSKRWLGPRLWRSGFIEGESPFAARGTGQVCATLEEALAWVDRHARRGYRGVKLYNSIRPEWMAPLVERAHSRGLRVSGHVPAFTRARDAILAGYQEIHHINQLLLNFVMKDGEDTRTLLRFIAVAERAKDLNLDGSEFQYFVALMKEKNVVHDPTMAAFEDMFVQAPGELSRVYGAIAPHLPAAARRRLYMTEMEAGAETRERYRASYRKAMEVLARLDRAGITLVPGTDSVAGFTLHREYEIWTEAGIPPARVLQHATIGAARVLGLEHEIGRVSPGFSADLALVDGDPTKDISSVRRIAMVVNQGDVFFPAEIYAALGIKPFADPVPLRMPSASAANTAAAR